MVPDLAQTHNRWLVAFSCAALALLGVIAGACRLFAEARQVDHRVNLLPGPPLSYATLSVIALVFVAGMAGNVGLLLWPLNRRQGAISAAVTGAAMGILLVAAAGYARLGISLFSRGPVSGGG